MLCDEMTFCCVNSDVTSQFAVLSSVLATNSLPGMTSNQNQLTNEFNVKILSRRPAVNNVIRSHWHLHNCSFLILAVFKSNSLSMFVVHHHQP